MFQGFWQALYGDKTCNLDMMFGVKEGSHLIRSGRTTGRMHIRACTNLTSPFVEIAKINLTV